MCRFHSPSAAPGAALPVCLWAQSDALIRARSLRPKHCLATTAPLNLTGYLETFPAWLGVDYHHYKALVLQDAV